MSKLAFFRQSGWMIVATTLSGVLFAFVHKLAKWPGTGMSNDEYTLFAALLNVLAQMTIPAIGIQLTMVKLAVEAEEANSRAKLNGATRALLRGTFVVWVISLVAVFLFRDSITANYRISNQWALWGTVMLGLMSLWSPMFLGILQGRQNFLWYGLLAILNSGVRLGFLGVVVFLGFANAAYGILAAVFGMVVALVISAVQVREVFSGPVEKFEWLPWLKRVTPMTLGYGAATFMLTVDTILIRRYFVESSQSEPFVIAGILARAVFFFVAPMTTVMFPKVAQSAARSEESSVLMQALGVTALLGVGAALALTIMPQVPVLILYSKDQLPATALIPTFAWCLLPLPVANVLVNNLLARERYGVVPWLVGIAAAYYFALSYVARTSAAAQAVHFENILYTIGAFGVLLLAVCLIYTWQDIRRLRRGR